jgi:hypothetical protein
MLRRRRDLLSEIEEGAFDPKTDLPTLLRKCLALGGEAGSESLRTWATRELKGYDNPDDLPAYRRAAAPLVLDALVPGGKVMGQQVPANLIPDFARDHVGSDIQFQQPISEIIDLLRSARSRGRDTVRLGPPGGNELVALMNHQLAQSNVGSFPFSSSSDQTIERIYWDVSLTPLERVLDVVRTTLVELVAEMRAGTPAGQKVPDRAVAEQAVAIAIKGNRNRVVIQQVSGEGQAAASADGSASVSTSEPESAGRKVMWWLAGTAGIVGAIAAVVTVLVQK